MNSKTYSFIVRGDELSRTLSFQAEKILKDNGYTRNDAHPETVFVIGGDGTFIYAVHQFMYRLNEVRFYGIHTGTLGFYSDFKGREIDKFMEVFLEQKTFETTYPILEAAVDGRVMCHGLNELRLENVARTQNIAVSINDRHFENFSGSGLCVSTQFGSTAYNRSLHGAVVMEGIECLELTEMSPVRHKDNRSLNTPLIMKPDTKLTFDSDNFKGCLLGADSDFYPMDHAHHIEIQAWKKSRVRILKGKKLSPLYRLRSLF